jgi:hypothetical protein
MGSLGRKLIGIALATAVVGVLIGLYIGLYLTRSPKALAAPAAVRGGTELNLATVPASGPADANPDWVSYFAVDRNGGNWRHTTIYRVPAHSLVHITLYQFDGDSGLRNPFLAQAQGVVPGTYRIDGKPASAINPDDASHIFAVPEMGISVPLPGVPDTAKNPCGAAPCSLKFDHRTISFTIRTGAPGHYRWQCFVPCAAGFIAGWGGPMQTIGYMDGFLEVV